MQDFGNIIAREDGSFVITHNDMPYHVPDNEEFHDLFLEVSAYARAHPDKVTLESVPEPDPQAERLARTEAIKAELAEIDFESIRPLRAIDNGTDTVDDHKKLVELETRAAALRVELEGLNG